MPNSTTNYEPLSTIRVIFNRAGGKLVFDYCQGDKWLITSDVNTQQDKPESYRGPDSSFSQRQAKC
jgi:hypothetical protein